MTATTSLDRAGLDDVRTPLQAANAAFARAFPGETDRRQPVHTVYGGAHLFKSDSAEKMGRVALRALDDYAADADALAAVLEWHGDQAKLAHIVHDRVVDKLKREPVEDFRIDFEDGYGNRPDAEEDGHAEQAALEVAKGMAAGSLPPFCGIRIKPFNDELFERSARTLDIFVSTIARESKGGVPDNFVVTLPKVTAAAQVTALVELLAKLEAATGLAAGILNIELMVETPQSLFDASGNINLPSLIDAAMGRCTGAHFGVYDYTALCNITAAYQAMTHPACDFARDVMQVALAQRGIHLSDGATNIMPVAPNRAVAGEELSLEQRGQNEQSVHRAWRLGYSDIVHSLQHAYYQGWDLHPAQLPIRYAAVYLFFLEGLEAASKRLSAFMDKAAQATLVGDVFDDAATGQGLLNYFLRALSCGAITEAEATATGLSVEEIRSRSFVKILRGRAAVSAGAGAASPTE